MNVRELALDAYTIIMDAGGYSNLVLNQMIEENDIIKEDRGLLTEIVYGAISNKMTIEYRLAPFIQTRVKKWQRNLLILSIYQLDYLDKIPSYAVINEAVKIAKEIGGRQSANQINGILRNYLRSEKRDPKTIQNTTRRISLQYSLPKWIVKQLISHHGEETTEEIAKSLLERPKMYLRTNKKKIDREALIETLINEDVRAVESPVHKDAIHVQGGGLTKTNAYKDGLFGIQDASSMCVNYALQPDTNDSILDACSAPGGKGFHALESMQGGHVDFCDVHEHKLILIKQEAKRLGHKNLSISCKDAATGDYGTLYDKIIVDAPCSGLGVIRRKPEIKYNIREEDIESFVGLQLSILNNAVKYLKPGGILVYSTCTLHQMENENVAFTFKKTNDDIEFDTFHIEPFGFEGTNRQILPHEFGTDGFYIARFIKRT
ncbi:16S rRNA (cytosine(967)-C(5))-methyltransferase RsmB [Phocicoccus pinnipedialis]|uniref:16S rRNA (cytosine(967)-C(5))-methyltransferase n=1 Tax=Phocicoccus pinnipedialis TaxID=110845 RepID=A0A6V7RII5_9BACL|nr:16S rRNA (cytosine(967)-C(5))-methyltransferase RsmB [Jeotgalicoccus pinnipedialis]MBP1939065.1 16S rRNA (cytosine967-C5)-methyltransferase [Jeotgalicoccus pinnipedialis]CAD2076951.1 Ribosomal RNA small subunit methyltransferase B [Jeotgalicoccus pinnipedialis]